MIKTCTKCNKEKDVKEFPHNRRVCKECEKEYQKEYRITHLKRISKRKKAYHIKNRKTISKKKYLDRKGSIIN